jgi:hypothetical protein
VQVSWEASCYQHTALVSDYVQGERAPTWQNAGAPGRTRTSTMFPPPDFESGASTNSATGARRADHTGGSGAVNDGVRGASGAMGGRRAGPALRGIRRNGALDCGHEGHDRQRRRNGLCERPGSGRGRAGGAGAAVGVATGRDR